MRRASIPFERRSLAVALSLRSGLRRGKKERSSTSSKAIWFTFAAACFALPFFLTFIGIAIAADSSSVFFVLRSCVFLGFSTVSTGSEERPNAEKRESRSAKETDFFMEVLPIFDSLRRRYSKLHPRGLAGEDFSHFDQIRENVPYQIRERMPNELTSVSHISPRRALFGSYRAGASHRRCREKRGRNGWGFLPFLP